MKSITKSQNYFFRICTLLFFLNLTFVSFSQELYSKEAEKIFPLANKVKVNVFDKSIQFFELKKDAKIKAENLELFLLKNLKISDEISVKIISEEKDQIGYFHFKYKFYFKDVEIENFVYTIHVKDGFILSGNGEYKLQSDFNSNIPIYTSSQAIEAAKMFVKSEHYIEDYALIPQTELIYIWFKTEFKLCYKTDVYSSEPLTRKYVFVDAKNGEILKDINRILHSDQIGIAHTKYSGVKNITTDHTGSTFSLKESGRGNGIQTYDLNNGADYTTATQFTDTDNLWNDTLNQNNVAYDAHFGAEATYDYYLNTFNRDSYDNNGAPIKSYVHYGFDFVNAFWDGSVMTYGDGDGVSYDAIVSLGVVGHEITHAVTEHSAGLIYDSESGALNESFSDIFGVVIEFANNPSTANYKIGDECDLNGLGFRDMANPNLFQNPDTYHGDFWNDWNDVHYNSAIQNLWFYILVNGQLGINDLGNFYDVGGIGMNSAAAIAYRNLTTYLTPSSTFMDARYYSIQSAIDLFGVCSDEVESVTNAWYAVGVGNLYTNDVESHFSADNTIFCTYPATVSFTNLSVNSTSYLWDFGDGQTSTSFNVNHVYNTPGNYTVSLLVQGLPICLSTQLSDVLIETNYIQISDGGGPVTPVCAPYQPNAYPDYFLAEFDFNTIHYQPNSVANNVYVDNSCSFSTTVTAGTIVPMEFKFGIYEFSTFAAVWIDYNNDGDFDLNERVYNATEYLHTHSPEILISNNTFFSTPLRVRVCLDYSSNISSCVASTYGQIVDFTVVILPNYNPPIADFKINDPYVLVNDDVQFLDWSQNVPTTWYWTFEGGTPSVSTEQYPIVSYANTGTYSVSLKTTNLYGEDTEVKNQFISVGNYNKMCTNLMSTKSSGVLFDSGGDANDYNNYEYCNFTIQPTDNYSNLYLTIELLNTEINDQLTIFVIDDFGNYNLLSTLSGNISGEFTFQTSDCFIISWSSDYYGDNSGFKLSWNITAGLNELKDGISVFPNPVNEQLIIKNQESAPIENIVITNTIGEEIFNKSIEIISDEEKINFSEFKPGVYFVKIYLEDKKVLTRKVVKN